MTFRTIRRLLAPRWLTTGEGGLLGYALDLVKDAFMERARLAHLYRFPQQDANGTPGPTDALAAMGRDRRVVRGIDETDRTYAGRLPDWLIDRRRSGNPYVLMKQLAAYCGDTGCSFRTYDVRGNCYSRAADGTETAVLNTGLWDWDGDTEAWARFWVIVYPGTLWVASGQEWGDAGTWGNTTSVWGSTTITAEQVVTLRALVNDWKPAGTRCQHIVLALDPASFDPAAPEPDGLWAKPYKYVGGVAVSSRLATANYLDGT